MSGLLNENPGVTGCSALLVSTEYGKSQSSLLLCDEPIATSCVAARSIESSCKEQSILATHGDPARKPMPRDLGGVKALV